MMRTNRTMTKTMTMTMTMIGAIVLVAAGCTVKTSHSIPVDTLPTIYAGFCSAVGSAVIPGGSSTSYSITDDFQDDMDIAVVDSSLGCDPTPADTAFTSGYGSVATSDIIPVTSSYQLVIFCNNLAADCIPTVDYWDYD